MMRKTAGMITGVLGGVVLAVSASFMTLAFIGSAENSLQRENVPYLYAAMAALAVVGILLCMVGQAVYEREQQGEVILRIGRWGRRGIFLFICTVFFWNVFYSFVLMSRNREMASSIGLRTLLVSAAAVIGAVWFFRNDDAAVKLYRARKQTSLKNTLTKGRRYEGLVTEANENGIVMRLNGRIRTGDPVIFTAPDGTETEERITEIYVNDVKRNTAADREVRIRTEKPVSVPQFTAASSVRTVSDPDQADAENPRINAMLENFSAYLQDERYMGILINDLRNGMYLVPEIQRKDLSGGTVTGFASVESAAMKGMHVLPVFTDWDALIRYRTISENPDMHPRVMSFEACQEPVREESGGIVINPFGKASFYLSVQTLHKIGQTDDHDAENSGL